MPYYLTIVRRRLFGSRMGAPAEQSFDDSTPYPTLKDAYTAIQRMTGVRPSASEAAVRSSDSKPVLTLEIETVPGDYTSAQQLMAFVHYEQRDPRYFGQMY